MEHLRHIKVLWLCTAGEHPVGIVKAWDTNEGQWKFYIGAGDGHDMDEDIRLIMAVGQKFYSLGFIQMFGNLEPPVEE